MSCYVVRRSLQPKKASRSPRQPPIPPGRPLCVSDREARADCQGVELIDRIAARAPGSSWPQSTRIVQLKRRPTSNVDSMIVLRARRGGTGSKYVTLRGGLRKAIPFLSLAQGVVRKVPNSMDRRQNGARRKGDFPDSQRTSASSSPLPGNKPSRLHS